MYGVWSLWFICKSDWDVCTNRLHFETVTCFISVSLDYGRVQIKFGDFNIGELLKNLPIANINSSPINHLVGYILINNQRKRR